MIDSDLQVLKNQVSTMETQLASLRGALQGVVLITDSGQTPERNTLVQNEYDISLNPPSLNLPSDETGTTVDFTLAYTYFKIKINNVETSDSWSYARTNGAGVTSALTGNRLDVTALTVDVGYVDITATRGGYQTLTRRLIITKAKQGLHGTAAITPLLTNEDVSCYSNPDGSSPILTGAITDMQVLSGGTDDTVNWTFSASPSSGVSGSLGSGATKNRWTTTGLSVDSGWVDITATRSGYSTMTKRFTLSKTKGGAAYSVTLSAAAIKQAQGGTLTPSTLVINAFSQLTGAPGAYAGRFKIYRNEVLDYTSASNESTKSYVVPAGTTILKVELYLAGGTTTLVDAQSAPVVLDGLTGTAPPQDSLVLALTGEDVPPYPDDTADQMLTVFSATPAGWTANGTATVTFTGESWNIAPNDAYWGYQYPVIATSKMIAVLVRVNAGIGYFGFAGAARNYPAGGTYLVSERSDGATPFLLYGTDATASLSVLAIYIGDGDFASKVIDSSKSDLRLDNKAVLPVVGLTGTALFFNAFSYLKIISSAFDRVNGQALNISCIIKPRRVTGNVQIIVNTTKSGVGTNWFLYLSDTDGHLSLGGAAVYESTWAPPVDVDTHVIATVSPAGQCVIKANNAIIYDSGIGGFGFGGATGELWIGQDAGSPSNFDGSISNLLIDTGAVWSDANQTWLYTNKNQLPNLSAINSTRQVEDATEDGVLNSNEKQGIIRQHADILTEQTQLDAQATALSITTQKTAYDTAVTALTTHLGTLTVPKAWNDTTGTTNVDRVTFRQKFGDVATTKEALRKAITDALDYQSDAAMTAANNANNEALAAPAKAPKYLGSFDTINNTPTPTANLNDWVHFKGATGGGYTNGALYKWTGSAWTTDGDKGHAGWALEDILANIAGGGSAPPGWTFLSSLVADTALILSLAVKTLRSANFDSYGGAGTSKMEVNLNSAFDRKHMRNSLNNGDTVIEQGRRGLAVVAYADTSVAATAMVAGNWYQILTVGTTVFTSYGALFGSVGETFIATGAGTGTGTVKLGAVKFTVDTDGNAALEGTVRGGKRYDKDGNTVDGSSFGYFLGKEGAAVAGIRFEGAQGGGVQWGGVSQIGSPFVVGGSPGVAAIAAVTKDDVAYIDSGSDSLIMLRFGGSTWSQVGNPLTIAGNDWPTLCPLDPDDVAYGDSSVSNGQLRKYHFDGTNWALVGSGLAIPSISVTASVSLSALNVNDVSLVHSGDYSIAKFHFSGSAWAKVGNSYGVESSSMNPGAIGTAAMSESRVAYLSAVGEYLRMLEFDGTNWAQIGTPLNIPGIGHPSIAALNATDVVVIDTTFDRFFIYRFLGSSWVKISEEVIPISGLTSVKISSMIGNEIALFGTGPNELRKYRFSFFLSSAWKYPFVG